MDKSETPLEFALRFAQMELSTLREGDWLNLREELDERFFHAGLPRGTTGHYDVEHTGGIAPVPLTDPLDLSEDELRALQLECKKLFESWATMQTVHDGYRNAVKSGDASEHLRFQRMRGPGVYNGKFSMDYDAIAYPGGGGAVNVFADVQSVFLFTLSMILQQGGSETLRVCLECRKLLSKRGRRKFCSPRCLDRATKRRYRSKKREADRHGKKK